MVSPTTTLFNVTLGLSPAVIAFTNVEPLVVMVALSVRFAAVPPTGVPLVTNPVELCAPDQFTIVPAAVSVDATDWVAESLRS